MATIQKHFNDLGELYAQAVRKGENEAYHNQWIKEDDKSFKGLTIEEMEAAKYSHPDGVKQLEKLPGIDMIRTGKNTATWDDDDGDDGDHERYLDERPFLIKRKKANGNGLKNNVKIIVNIGENCQTEYIAMLWKTYAAAKLADELESQGIRVEIEALTKSTQSYKFNANNHIFSVTIKRCEDPLNLALLCTTLSPWFLRHWVFSVVINSHKNVYEHLGHYEEIGSKHDTEAIIIDKGQCLSQTDAKNFLANFKIN